MSVTQNWGRGDKGQVLRKVKLSGFLPRALGRQVVPDEEPGITGSPGHTEGLGHSSTQACMPTRKYHQLHLKRVCNFPMQSFALQTRAREPQVPSLKLL